MKLLVTSSIQRVNEVSPDQCDMVREAIRGEFEPGKYLRDMGTGALAGAAGGAVAGAGIGSLPGAAVGAIGGAAFGLGSNAIGDIAYQIYNNETKAAWQAEDIQGKLNKMGGMLAGKTKKPEFGELLSTLGTFYKNYIDVAVNSSKDKDQAKMFEQNLFNPKSQAYTTFQSALPQGRAAFKKTKFVKVAASDTGSVGAVGGTGTALVTEKALYSYLQNPNSVTNEVGQLIRQQLQNNPTVQTMANQMKNMMSQGGSWRAPDTIPQSWNTGYDAWMKSTARQPGESFIDTAVQGPNGSYSVKNPMQESYQTAEQIAEQRALQATGKSWLNPKNILNATWKGVKGLGVGLAVDFASNWAVDAIDMAMTGGEINMFRRDLEDIRKTITEINRLTNNKEEVVYAGNMLWTNLKQIDRTLGEAGDKKAQTTQPTDAQQVNPQTTENQPDGTLPAPAPPVQALSRLDKFKRLA